MVDPYGDTFLLLTTQHVANYSKSYVTLCSFSITHAIPQKRFLSYHNKVQEMLGLHKIEQLLSQLDT